MINIAGGASFCIIIIICLFIWKTCLSKGCKVVWQFKSTQAVSRTDLYNPVESAHWNGAHTISLLFVSFASFFLQTFKWTLPLQNITLTVVVASIFKNQHVTVREQYFKVSLDRGYHSSYPKWKKMSGMESITGAVEPAQIFYKNDMSPVMIHNNKLIIMIIPKSLGSNFANQ